MTNRRWWTWLEGQLEELGWSRADLARAADVSQGRIAGWKDAGIAPSIDNARGVAHALGVPLLTVLVEAEILTPEEARQRTIRAVSIQDFTTRQILRELERRLTAQST